MHQAEQNMPSWRTLFPNRLVRIGRFLFYMTMLHETNAFHNMHLTNPFHNINVPVVYLNKRLKNSHSPRFLFQKSQHKSSNEQSPSITNLYAATKNEQEQVGLPTFITGIFSSTN